VSTISALGAEWVSRHAPLHRHKDGIIGFMRGLANDAASDGITANAVLPGLTNTLAIAPQSEEQEAPPGNSKPSSLGEPESVSDRLSSWRTEERKLGQSSICRVFELGNGNFEKSRADFGRKAGQNSKHKAVPR
jgi:NAD(P)-dependent dehydrogenase (short-subunit alcohol dehydrogenase family)